jgi:hypothetical protein
MPAHDVRDVPQCDVRLRRDRRLVVVEVDVVDLTHRAGLQNDGKRRIVEDVQLGVDRVALATMIPRACIAATDDGCPLINSEKGTAAGSMRRTVSV